MKYIIVNWIKEYNGSQFTLHEVDSYDKEDVFWAIDELGDPSETKHTKVDPRYIKFSDKDASSLEAFGYVDNKSMCKQLKKIWERRFKTKPREKIKSKYIKVKHPVWGVIDEHRAVMQDHLGYKLPSDVVVHHINDDKHDNRLENLEVMSLSEHSRMHMKAKPNIRHLTKEDREHLSRINSGENQACAKLTNTQAALVLAMKGAMSQRQVAKLFGISHDIVGRIHRGQIYKAAQTVKLLPIAPQPA